MPAGVLAFFRHGDGALALFNDGDIGDAPILKAVEERLGALPEAPPALETAGYHRLTGGSTVVLFDTARAAPDDLPAHAHADMLSFELSDGPARIVVNGGTYAYQDAEWRNRLRGTAAHSTVIVDDLDSAEVFGAFRLGRRPREVTFNGSQGHGGRTVVGRHDGYRHLGLVHRRRLKLSPDGSELSAEDRMEAYDGTVPAGHRMTARFHLHPDVTASAEKNGSIRLALPIGAVWLFSAKERIPPGRQRLRPPPLREASHPVRSSCGRPRAHAICCPGTSSARPDPPLPLPHRLRYKFRHGLDLCRGVVPVAVFAASLAAARLVLELLRRRAILALPNERSSHATPTPTGGGIAVIAVVLAAWYGMAPHSGMPQGIEYVLVGAAGLALLSWLDDLYDLSPLIRLATQLMAVILVFMRAPADGAYFGGLLSNIADVSSPA